MAREPARAGRLSSRSYSLAPLGPPLTYDQAVLYPMLVVAVLSVVFAASTLVAQDDLREHPTASLIAPEVRGVDVVEPQFLKSIAHDLSGGLGG